MGDATLNTKNGLSLHTKTDALRRNFEQFGEIDEAKVITDTDTGKPMGYGYVPYKDAEAAQTASRDLIPIIDGKIVSCNPADVDTENNMTPASSTLQPHEFFGVFNIEDRESYGIVEPTVDSWYQPPSDPHGIVEPPYEPPQYSYEPNSLWYPPHDTDFLMDLRTRPEVDDTSMRKYGLSPLPVMDNNMHKDKTAWGELCSPTRTNIPFRFLLMAMNLQLGPSRDKNFVFSPGSIQLALSLVANGSTNETLIDFLKVLEAKDLGQLNSVATDLIMSLSGTNEDGLKLSFAGGAWVDQSMSLKPTFQNKAATIYRATAKAVDFENKIKVAIDAVNKWAEAATNGLIEFILPPDLPNTTRVVLANALYFKGAWNRKFDKRCTRNDKFHLQDGTVLDPNFVVIPFMTSREDQDITTYGDYKILRLPYKKAISSEAALSMYIILPIEVHGLWRLIERVGSDPSFFDKHLRPGSRVEVGDFRIPKFKITFDFEASKVLQSIGLERCFSDAAEFDDMAEKKLKITHVFHKAHIEANEEGTEAAASTSVMGASLCAGPPPWAWPVDFVADHPFMFIVKDDKSGMVLFMGHIINPLL